MKIFGTFLEGGLRKFLQFFFGGAGSENLLFWKIGSSLLD